MNEIGEAALKAGLENVWWRSYYPTEVSKRVIETAKELSEVEVKVKHKGARLASAYSKLAGCVKEDRVCGECERKFNCPAGLKEPWLLDLD
jgi:hypothetical protein